MESDTPTREPPAVIDYRLAEEVLGIVLGGRDSLVEAKAMSLARWGVLMEMIDTCLGPAGQFRSWAFREVATEQNMYYYFPHLRARITISRVSGQVVNYTFDT